MVLTTLAKIHNRTLPQHRDCGISGTLSRFFRQFSQGFDLTKASWWWRQLSTVVVKCSRNMRGLSRGDSSDPTTTVEEYLYAPPLYSLQLLKRSLRSLYTPPQHTFNTQVSGFCVQLSTSSKNPQTAATGCNCVHRTTLTLQADCAQICSAQICSAAPLQTPTQQMLLLNTCKLLSSLHHTHCLWVGQTTFGCSVA